MLIDVRTTYLLVGLLYIVLPLTVFVLLKEYRRSSVTLWCAGGLIAGSGMVFFGLRPFLEGNYPGFITYTAWYRDWETDRKSVV